jgi:hypothetical protein
MQCVQTSRILACDNQDFACFADRRQTMGQVRIEVRAFAFAYHVRLVVQLEE